MITFHISDEQAEDILNHYGVIVNDEDQMEIEVCTLLDEMIDEVCHAD